MRTWWILYVHDIQIHNWVTAGGDSTTLRCHMVAISLIGIIPLTLHFVSPNSSHTSLFHHTFLLLPVPSSLAFVPYPLASNLIEVAD